MPSYKLKYFPVRGRAETARYLFALGGQQFEDIRIPQDKWPSEKASTPYAQLPVLLIDDKPLAQSDAIARYLARQFGLAGKDSLETACIDEIMCLLDDMFAELIKTFLEKDEEKKKELQKNMDEVVYPKYLGYFEKILEKNGGQYLVGKNLTLADVIVVSSFESQVKKNANFMDKFPKLKAHRTRFLALPKIAEYIKKRPDTEF